jgi:hypothetical protein
MALDFSHIETIVGIGIVILGLENNSYSSL